MHTLIGSRFFFLLVRLLLLAASVLREGPLGKRTPFYRREVGWNLPRVVRSTLPTSDPPYQKEEIVRRKTYEVEKTQKNGGTTKFAAAPLFFVVFFTLSCVLLPDSTYVCVRLVVETRLTIGEERSRRRKAAAAQKNFLSSFSPKSLRGRTVDDGALLPPKRDPEWPRYGFPEEKSTFTARCTVFGSLFSRTVKPRNL